MRETAAERGYLVNSRITSNPEVNFRFADYLFGETDWSHTIVKVA
jgi:hypothetical protein